MLQPTLLFPSTYSFFVYEGPLHKTLPSEPVQVLNSAMCPAAEMTTSAWYYSKILEFGKESRFLHFANATEFLIFKNVIRRLKLLQTFPEVQLQDFFLGYSQRPLSHGAGFGEGMCHNIQIHRPYSVAPSQLMSAEGNLSVSHFEIFQ